MIRFRVTGDGASGQLWIVEGDLLAIDESQPDLAAEVICERILERRIDGGPLVAARQSRAENQQKTPLPELRTLRHAFAPFRGGARRCGISL